MICLLVQKSRGFGMRSHYSLMASTGQLTVIDQSPQGRYKKAGRVVTGFYR